mgnify:CR=1 FL=1
MLITRMHVLLLLVVRTFYQCVGSAPPSLIISEAAMFLPGDRIEGLRPYNFFNLREIFFEETAYYLFVHFVCFALLASS